MSHQSFAPTRFTFCLNHEARTFIEDFGLHDELLFINEHDWRRLALASGQMYFPPESLMNSLSLSRLEESLAADPLQPLVQLGEGVQQVIIGAKERVRQHPLSKRANRPLQENIPWLAEEAQQAVSAIMRQRYPQHYGEGAHFFCSVKEAGVACGREERGKMALRPYYRLAITMHRQHLSTEPTFEGVGVVHGRTLVNLEDQDLQQSVAEMSRKRPYMWLLDGRSPLYDQESFAAAAGAICAEEVEDGLVSSVRQDLATLLRNIEGAIDRFGGGLRDILPTKNI